MITIKVHECPSVLSSSLSLLSNEQLVEVDSETLVDDGAQKTIDIIKTLIQTKRYMAHDEANTCKAGDVVLLEESPPISRNKKWKLKEVLKVYEQ